MLRQSLKSLTPEPSEIIRAAGLEETIRAENIPVEGYVALANALDAMRGSRA
jgi:16S rRNA (adenine1518-N6/adenine1519-N6)-dimethyltransferase